MTHVDNDFGTITLMCDEVGCEQEETFEGFDGHPDFTTMSRDARASGWEIVKSGSDWKHYCPTHNHKHHDQD